MSIRAVRKGLGLFIVDLFIIIGIFVLQFRTDSNILEKIGNLQISLEKADDNSGKKENSDISDPLFPVISEADEAVENIDVPTPVKNKLQVTYNGVNFSADDQNPAKVMKKGQTEAKDAVLLSYSLAPLSACFNFSDNVMLLFELSNDTPDAALSVSAILPDEISSFQIPYNFAYTMNIIGNEGNSTLVDSKKQTWNLLSEKTEDGYVVFSQKENLALYSIFDNTKKFGFEDLLEVAYAQEDAFNNTMDTFTSNLIASFKSALSENNYTEKSVIAYVAALADKGSYQQAIDEIPQSYKKSDQRTYLSSPFFNNLAKHHDSIEKEYDDVVNIISKAATSNSLDIFTTENFAEHLCIYPDKVGAKKILENAAYADISASSLAQATGILKAYTIFADKNPEYAKIIQSVVDPCIQKITESCKFDNKILTISENDTFLSVVQAVETGTAVLRYGELTDNETYIKAGRVIINSYMEGSNSFDLRTLSNLYPILFYNNWYYPHIEIIKNGSNYNWAWTCAKSIKYEKDSDNTLTVTIDFPEGLTHYVMLKDIPEFETIYIYNMAFRTDPRFETYNSSGYVYKSSDETLLLKSRHKSKIETIRMTKSGVSKSKASTSKPAAPVKKAEPEKAADAEVKVEAPALSEPEKAAESEKESEKTEAAAEAAAPQPEIKKDYKVVLTAIPQNKRPVVSVIQEVTGNPLFSEKDLAELPLVLKTNLSESEANIIIYRLTSAGGTAEKQ